jgi:hypothetical protein
VEGKGAHACTDKSYASQTHGWMSLRRLSKKSKVDCEFDGSENGPRHVRKRCVSAERIRAQNTIDEDMNEHRTWTM